MSKEPPRVYKSLVYHGETCLGVLDVIPVSGQNFQFPNNEIRIHHVSPPSDRCLPLSVLQTVASVRCKLESSSSVEQPRLINLHAACFSELKTAAVVLGDEEIHLVAMPSKRNKLPCFWCYSVPFGLYRSSMELLNARCLAIVFDLDETLFVANTMKSFNDRVEALQSCLARETDPVKLRGIVAELKWYADDRALLMQYTENDCVMDNGKMFKVQMEEVLQSSGGHEKVHRPIIRMHENKIVLTRINPEVRDTSVLVRLRPSWEDLRSYLIAKGRKRFEVYVCTMAEREYALEMWRLLDPEANLIASSQLQDRVVPVKSGDKKSLQSIFQDGKCHPKMAVVIDDRLKVWEDRDQPQVHVVPRFDPCYAPQAEMTNPVLCVVRNVVCNVRGCFFKEFDENFLPKMSYIFYEDDVANLPPAPDVSNYLISKVLQDPPVLRRNPSAPKHRSEVDQRLNQACGSMAAVRNIISELNKGIKLNGDNYKIWHKNVRMVLVEMNAIDHINRLVERPVRGITDEQRVILNKWDAKDAEVRAAILSTMDDNILYVFEQFQTSKELWDALRSRFGGYTTAQLRSLNIAFDSYRMNPQHNMREHLMHMANMVAELREAGQVLTEEQKIQALIRSLPDSWEHVKIRLAHSEHLNTVELVWKQLELEEDLLKAQKPQPQPDKKRKRKRRGKNEDQPSPTIPVTNEQKTQPKGKGNGAASNPKGKFRKMQNIRCFRCGQKGHLAGACKNPPQNHGQPAA